MHHTARVRVVGRAANLSDQADPRRDIGIARIRIFDEVDAIDEFHCEPRHTSARALVGACRVQAGNRRVLERGEQLALALEARERFGTERRGPQDFQRDEPGRRLLFREVDAPHRALAEHAHDAEATDAFRMGVRVLHWRVRAVRLPWSLPRATRY